MSKQKGNIYHPYRSLSRLYRIIQSIGDNIHDHRHVSSESAGCLAISSSTAAVSTSRYLIVILLINDLDIEIFLLTLVV
jgi:hypothetical protein